MSPHTVKDFGKSHEEKLVQEHPTSRGGETVEGKALRAQARGSLHTVSFQSHLRVLLV